MQTLRCGDWCLLQKRNSPDYCRHVALRKAKARRAMQRSPAPALTPAALPRLCWRRACPCCTQVALQHIVDQLSMLTQTMSLMEERLTLNEDKARDCIAWNSVLVLDCYDEVKRAGV